jgi:hypothetical protein
MKAYKSLIKSALNSGLKVSADDGGERFKDIGYSEAVSIVESVEVASIYVSSDDGHVASFLCIPYGVAGNESVADYTDCHWANTWADAYYINESFEGPVALPEEGE